MSGVIPLEDPRQENAGYENASCYKNGIARRPGIKRPDIGKEQEGDEEIEPAPDDIGGRRTELRPLQASERCAKGPAADAIDGIGTPLVRNAAAIK